jgi:hypothetical protein
MAYSNSVIISPEHNDQFDSRHVRQQCCLTFLRWTQVNGFVRHNGRDSVVVRVVVEAKEVIRTLGLLIHESVIHREGNRDLKHTGLEKLKRSVSLVDKSVAHVPQAHSRS